MLHSVGLIEINEPCSHEIQFGGMCANCGKDMSECVLRPYVDYLED